MEMVATDKGDGQVEEYLAVQCLAYPSEEVPSREVSLTAVVGHGPPAFVSWRSSA